MAVRKISHKMTSQHGKTHAKMDLKSRQFHKLWPSVKRLSKLLFATLITCAAVALTAHVIQAPDPELETLNKADLPDLQSARDQVAYAMGYEYGQRFRTENNIQQLPLEAFIRGLKQATTDQAAHIDQATLKKAVYVLQLSHLDNHSTPHP